VKDLVFDFNIETTDADTKKVVAFVHANIDYAGKSLETERGWCSQGCAGHTLQLCVNAGLKVSSTIDRAIGAARRLVTHFRKSEPASRVLKCRQDDMWVPENAFICSCQFSLHLLQSTW